MSHLGTIFSGFTLFALLRRLFNWVLGRPTIENKTGSSLAKEFRSKKTSWSTVFAILAMTAVSAPILLIMLKRVAKSLGADTEVDDEEEDIEGLSPFHFISILRMEAR